MFTPAACAPVGGTSRLIRVASAAQRGVTQLFLSVTISRDCLHLEALLVDVLADSTSVESRHRFTLSSDCPRSTLLDRTAEGSGVDVPVGTEIGSARFSKFLPDLWRYDNVYVDQRTNPHSRFTFHLPTRREDVGHTAASTRSKLEPVVVRVVQNVAAISDREQDEVAPHATASRVWPCAYVLAKTVEALCCANLEPSTLPETGEHRWVAGDDESSTQKTETEMIQEVVQALALALRRPMRGVKSIELGCGLALPSLVLAAHLQRTMPQCDPNGLKTRACVLATELPENLELVKQQICLNAAVVGCNLDGRGDIRAAASSSEQDGTIAEHSLIQPVACNWTELPTGLVKQFSVDRDVNILLCADCVFWPWLFQPLIQTLQRLAVQDTIVLLAVKERLGSRAKEFLRLLHPHFAMKPLNQLPVAQEPFLASVAGIADRLDVQILACRKRPQQVAGACITSNVNESETTVGSGGGGATKTTSRQRKREWQRNRQLVSRLAHLAPLHLVLDLEFTSQLSSREQKSLATQAIILYSEVRKCDAPVHLVLASCDASRLGAPDRKKGAGEHGTVTAETSAIKPNICDAFYQTLARNHPAQWDQSLVSFVSGNISSIFGEEKNVVDVPNDGAASCCSRPHAAPNHIVYLSPDSEQLLTRVYPRTTYVFGGIVDRTHAKNLSKQKADSIGVSCARLPLREFGGYPKNRPCVLNIDAAARIILEVFIDVHANANVSTDISEGNVTNDKMWQEAWKKAIEKHLPRRLLAEEENLSAQSPLPRTVIELNSLSKSQIGESSK